MGWKKVETEVHKCDVPRHDVGHALRVGSVIECDCGKRWKLAWIEYGSQWDRLPVPVLRWKEA